MEHLKQVFLLSCLCCSALFASAQTTVDYFLNGQRTTFHVMKGNVIVAGDLSNRYLRLAKGTEVTLNFTLQPSSDYLLTLDAMTESGADNLSIFVSGLGADDVSASSARADWTRIPLVFHVPSQKKRAHLVISYDTNQNGEAVYVKNISLKRTGDYRESVYLGIPKARKRVMKTDMGIAMQPDDRIQWMLDDKLGMFIHWGLYAGPAQGEWYMENKGVSIEDYRKLAYPGSSDQYFAADQFNAEEWVNLAQEMGAKYMNMVTEHHDGYALFESHYMNAFTSKQTHNRDFVKEYTDAARAAGMKVGIYKTLINWRYPGYYDVTGTDCKPNKFGYVTAPWHRENARQMKEELYCQVRELLTHYGPIDQIYWDGGWLAQQGSDADGAYFWESGEYLSSDSPWPVNPLFQVKDSISGKPLGLMGMVRQLQPHALVNPRSGWIGDYTCEEGGGPVKGPVRSGLVEKNMTITQAWGYTHSAEENHNVRSLADLKRIFSDCLVRNMCLLINVGPDRHGHIPDAVQMRLRDFGVWVKNNAQAIYGTRGGPWNPVDGQYGYTYKDNMLYVYFLGGYMDNTFSLPLIDKGMKVLRAYRVSSGEKVKFHQDKQRVGLAGIHPIKGDITIIALELNKKVR